MAYRQPPHFEHHRRETQLTRRRFALTVMVLFAGLSVAVGLQYAASHAATVPEIASGIAGKCMEDLQNTGGTNNHAAVLWGCTGTANQQIVISGSQVSEGTLCLAALDGGIANGTPIHFVGCSTADNQVWTHPNDTLVNTKSGKCLDDPGSTSVNGTVLQLFTCNGTKAQTWVPGSFVINTPTPTTPPPTTPPPTHPPTPTTPPPTHTPTPPTHTPTPVPNPGGGGSGGGGDPQSTAATPNTPDNFNATVSSDNAVVTLTWSASDDASGIAGYQLENSYDQVAWSVISSTITNTFYLDKSASFGIHYFYRVKAVDKAGNASPYASTDITTPGFSGSSDASSSNTYTSDDHIATVLVPSGAVSSSVDCSITPDTNIKVSTSLKVVVGPYALLCKDSSGAVVQSYNQPLQWALDLKSKLKGLTGPQAETVSSTGAVKVVKNGKFASATQLLTFTTTTTDEVVAVAGVSHGVSWNFVVAMLVLVGIIAGVLIMVLRKQQKSSYDDYLRQKYYNL